MDDVEDFGEFQSQVDALEQSMESARDVTVAFEAELAAMQITMDDTGKQVAHLNRSIGRGLKTAFDDLIFEGAKLSDVLTNMAMTVSRQAYNQAVTPVFNHLGGMLGNGLQSLIGGILPFANGAAFSQGRVVPFASGGVVRGPVAFPMRGATGLMGEAGPEAILPLTRGPDGRLGVRSAGGGQGVQVVMNISTPDVSGFERSQSQIAAQMTRALGRAQRNR